jgi:hypothetical protein
MPLKQRFHPSQQRFTGFAQPLAQASEEATGHRSFLHCRGSGRCRLGTGVFPGRSPGNSHTLPQAEGEHADDKQCQGEKCQ